MPCIQTMPMPSRSVRLSLWFAHAGVHIVDPRTVLSPDTGAKLSSVQIELPQALLKEPPHFELGDADDPMSTWIFGERAEIFQYKFLGADPLHTDPTEHTPMHPAAQVSMAYPIDQMGIVCQSDSVSMLPQEAIQQPGSPPGAALQLCAVVW